MILLHKKFMKIKRLKKKCEHYNLSQKIKD